MPAPARSKDTLRVSFDVGTRNLPATSARITTGMLRKNTEPHQKCSRSQPLVTGPMAPPAPATPAQMPMARAGSLGGETLGGDGSVASLTSEAPAPMIARPAMV